MTERDREPPPGGAACERPLQSGQSQAAQTPVAQHGDALSPGQALADSVNAAGSQRVGSSPPLANPIVSFPEQPAAEPDASPAAEAEVSEEDQPERS